jgi:hypothetical protein
MAQLPFVSEKPPTWFSLPEGLLHDFWHNQAFPKGFSPPANKTFAADIVMPFNTPSPNGSNPLLACGFTHLNPNTVPNNITGGAKAHGFKLMSDPEWCDMTDGNNTNKWQVDKILNHTKTAKLIILDYESQHGQPTNAMINKMADINKKMNAAGSQLALWAQGLVQNYALYMPGTGEHSLVSAKYWAEKYQNPASAANPMVQRAGLGVSMPFGYYLSYGHGDYLHRLTQAHETAKLLKPGIQSLPSLWIQQEHVDGYTQSNIEIKQQNGNILRRNIKLQAPATYVYGTALWGAVWDGWYHFEEGRLYTTNSNMARPTDGYENMPTERYQGTNHRVRYVGKYMGYYNYVYLALWQMSQPHIKPIIEANTSWQIPEYKTNQENQWRQGNERLPSYAYIRKEPIVRFKYDLANKTVLILAQNPYNKDFQTLSIRDRAAGWQTEINLEAGWPQIGIVSL